MRNSVELVQTYWWLPLLGVCVASVTLVTTFSLYYSQNRDYGGLKFPYISDTGRKYPEKYIFVVGLVILALLSILGHWLVSRWLKHYLTRSNTKIIVNIGFGMAILANICLILLAGFDNGEYETFHDIAAGGFFLISLVLNTSYLYLLFHRKRSITPPDPILRTSVRAKMVLVILSWLGFLFFSPIGRAWARAQYGSDHSFRSDTGINEAIAAAELLMAVFLMLFIGSWSYDFYNAKVLSERLSREASVDVEDQPTREVEESASTPQGSRAVVATAV
eukprot:m.35355 g.35355  ORF g.35355 m.35355 type:complete len:277 (-) comp12387_c0_seq1:105-935(-)